MKIIIIGDIMLDIYFNSITTRFAPEANIPIYNTKNIDYKLGGASNIIFNLNNLNCECELISIIGDDIEGNIIKNILDKNNIKYNLFLDKERKTTQKNRIICNDKIVCRYDIEDIHDINDKYENDIFEYIKQIKNIDGIIISDYDKGLITENLCKNIINY